MVLPICSICLEVFYFDGDEIVSLPCCHVFHKSCVVSAYRQRGCPKCRNVSSLSDEKEIFRPLKFDLEEAVRTDEQKVLEMQSALNSVLDRLDHANHENSKLRSQTFVLRRHALVQTENDDSSVTTVSEPDSLLSGFQQPVELFAPVRNGDSAWDNTDGVPLLQSSAYNGSLGSNVNMVYPVAGLSMLYPVTVPGYGLDLSSTPQLAQEEEDNDNNIDDINWDVCLGEFLTSSSADNENNLPDDFGGLAISEAESDNTDFNYDGDSTGFQLQEPVTLGTGETDSDFYTGFGILASPSPSSVSTMNFEAAEFQPGRTGYLHWATPLATREKHVLQIIDPNTGINIIQ